MRLIKHVNTLVILWFLILFYIIKICMYFLVYAHFAFVLANNLNLGYFDS